MNKIKRTKLENKFMKLMNTKVSINVTPTDLLLIRSYLDCDIVRCERTRFNNIINRKKMDKRNERYLKDVTLLKNKLLKQEDKMSISKQIEKIVMKIPED